MANMLSTMEPWEAVAGGYAETTMKLFQPMADKALSLAAVTPACHILDLACGPGTLALKAAEKAASVKAVDFSEAMTKILELKALEKGIITIDIKC